jgi:hypothetical protein
MILSEWERSLKLTFDLLSNNNIKRFEQPEKKTYNNYCGYNNTGYIGRYHDDYDYDYGYSHRDDYFNKNCEKTKPTEPLKLAESGSQNLYSNILVCPRCDSMMDLAEYRSSDNRCTFCQEKF